MRRVYVRDALGRFARTSGHATKATAKAAKKTYVSGSATRHLTVGPRGSYKTLTVGADFATRSGRSARVTASAGYHGPTKRKLDVTPRLDKSQSQLSVAVSRRTSAGKKSGTPKRGTAGRKAR